MNRTIEAFESGNVYAQQSGRSNREAPWAPHAKFAGVSMKTLVSGQDCGGSFSTHLVHVEVGCEIGEHIHGTQIELHEVFDGEGRCSIDGQEISYAPGTSAVIPAGTLHSVRAADKDLFLKATFVPALA